MGVSSSPGFIGCRVYNSIDLSIADNTETDVTFDSERFDTAGLHSTSSNTERLTAQADGYYHIGGSVQWASSVLGTRAVGIRYNGTGNYITLAHASNMTAASLGRRNVDAVYYLNAGDYVTLTVYHTVGGGTPTNLVSVANHSPEFWMYRVAL